MDYIDGVAAQLMQRRYPTATTNFGD